MILAQLYIGYAQAAEAWAEAEGVLSTYRMACSRQPEAWRAQWAGGANELVSGSVFTAMRRDPYILHGNVLVWIDIRCTTAPRLAAGRRATPTGRGPNPDPRGRPPLPLCVMAASTEEVEANGLTWLPGDIVDVETEDGIEVASVVGRSKSGDKTELRVRFADGAVDDWDAEDMKKKWAVGEDIEVDTDDGMERATILGAPESGSHTEMRVRFADGVIDDWEWADFLSIETGSGQKLVQKPEHTADQPPDTEEGGSSSEPEDPDMVSDDEEPEDSDLASDDEGPTDPPGVKPEHTADQPPDTEEGGSSSEPEDPNMASDDEEPEGSDLASDDEGPTDSVAIPPPSMPARPEQVLETMLEAAATDSNVQTLGCNSLSALADADGSDWPKRRTSAGVLLTEQGAVAAVLRAMDANPTAPELQVSRWALAPSKGISTIGHRGTA
jgi:hypothetical protein